MATKLIKQFAPEMVDEIPSQTGTGQPTYQIKPQFVDVLNESLDAMSRKELPPKAVINATKKRRKSDWEALGQQFRDKNKQTQTVSPQGIEAPKDTTTKPSEKTAVLTIPEAERSQYVEGKEYVNPEDGKKYKYINGKMIPAK